MKRYVLVLMITVAACVGGVVGSIVTLRYFDFSLTPYNSISERQKLVLANYQHDTTYRVPGELDFLATAKRVIPGVVHIRTSYGPGDFSFNPLQNYMENQVHSSGSGVIVSDDGYVVTNHHVIDEASNVEVIMNNNQRFYAKVMGTDPSTDLALLKIKANNLPFVKYGDSDALNPGEWVLAIGNPFDLNSTVTAGIVSAKARNIGILRDRNNLTVEAFIQTDAAVNPGNSGGALVNVRGELIGINSAIATSSGSYQGYSFAIPVSLVRKVIDDLLEFGQVQRGLLGIQITDVNAEIADQLALKVNQGVLVNRVNEGSAAEFSGMEAGDVITGINKHNISSVSELQEWVARNRPGAEIDVEFLREGETRNVKAKLRNNEGTLAMDKKEVRYEFDGVRLEDIPYKELTDLQLEGGARVVSVKNGKWKEAGVKENFIIGYVDRIPVDNVEDLNRILEFKKGGILIEGFYPGGQKGTYGLAW